MNNVLKIDPSLETHKITSFIKNVLKKQGFKKVVIGMSGGVDSTASFYLLKEAIAPENIIIAHLYYLDSQFKDIEPTLKQASIPKNNIHEMSIDPFVEAFQKDQSLSLSLQGAKNERRSNPKDIEIASPAVLGRNDNTSKIRLGNIMARIRMIILYDLSKKHDALVVGTENRSEFLLGYFTRFGDEASDFEPIQHLYKTQVYELAKYLGLPDNIIKKTPTAGLWPGQTDEGEFGFTYKEADEVLFYYYDKKLKLEEIKKKGLANADKIIAFSLKNAYKHHTPYTIEK